MGAETASAPTDLDASLDASLGAELAGVSRAEAAVRRVLRIADVPPSAAGDLYGTFNRSILVSAVRCLITYIVLPFVAPLIGVIQGVGPIAGLTLGTVAIAFNLSSMRRFFIARHRWRWGYFAIGASVIALLLVLMAGDVADLVGRL